jgi:transposase
MEGLSARARAVGYRVSRRTVRAALRPRRPLPPRASKLDPFKPAIDEILRADPDAPREQQRTAKRIYDRLLDEQRMVGVSYRVVRAYVAAGKPKIRAEAGRACRSSCRAASNATVRRDQAG